MCGSDGWDLLEEDRRAPGNHIAVLNREWNSELAERRAGFVTLTPVFALEEMDMANPREARMGADDLLELLVECLNDWRFDLNEVWQHYRIPREDRCVDSLWHSRPRSVGQQPPAPAHQTCAASTAPGT